MNTKNLNRSNIADAIQCHGIEILTQTRIGYLNECFKKHWFRFERGLVPISEKEHTLSFGSLIHDCLEIWHEPEPDDVSNDISANDNGDLVVPVTPKDESQ